MKKIKLLILPLLVISLASCNKQMFDFDNKFEKVHIFKQEKCHEIDAWTDYENSDQVQVKTKNGDVWLFHSSEVILVHGKCPICGK